jgi:hypothetical protein
MIGCFPASPSAMDLDTAKKPVWLDLLMLKKNAKLWAFNAASEEGMARAVCEVLEDVALLDSDDNSNDEEGICPSGMAADRLKGVLSDMSEEYLLHSALGEDPQLLGCPEYPLLQARAPLQQPAASPLASAPISGFATQAAFWSAGAAGCMRRVPLARVIAWIATTTHCTFDAGMKFRRLKAQASRANQARLPPIPGAPPVTYLRDSLLCETPTSDGRCPSSLAPPLCAAAAATAAVRLTLVRRCPPGWDDSRRSPACAPRVLLCCSAGDICHTEGCHARPAGWRKHWGMRACRTDVGARKGSCTFQRAHCFVPW